MMIDITEYGAVGDGKTVNTKAISAAIGACHRNGGGTVVVPTGVFLTGSIELVSNVTLYLDSGCTLRATGKSDDFPYIGFYHNEMHETTSVIWAQNQQNVSICGNGTIDLNADAYYGEDTKKIYDGEPSESNKQHFIFRKNEDRINQPLFFESCRNVKVENINIIHSPCWTVTFSRSSDIVVCGVTIRNSPHVPNDDGIHLSACRNALISNCNISCLDDCIAVTSITAHGQENSHIGITNCILSSRSSAIRLGHKISDVTVSNVNIYDNNRGIGIFTAKNGYIQNVAVNNVIMHNRLFESVCWGKGEAVVIAAAFPETYIRNLKFSNIVASAANGILIFGNGNNIQDVTFDNVQIQLEAGKSADSFMDLRPYYQKQCRGKAIKKWVKGAKKVRWHNTKISFSPHGAPKDPKKA